MKLGKTSQAIVKKLNKKTQRQSYANRTHVIRYTGKTYQCRRPIRQRKKSMPTASFSLLSVLGSK